MASEIQTIEHDVLVVGAGGAGLRAAIECGMSGLDTGMVTKSLLGKAHTVMAEGGMAAALGYVDDRDNWKVHFRDTMRGGKFLNNWRMAEHHARNAPERVKELEEWGAVFDRTKDGLINQRNFGGHRFPRLAHVGDRTGLEMIRSLQDHGIHSNVNVHAECTGIDVLKDGDKVSGLLAYWKHSGRFVIFKAKAVIFATGGGGKCWRVTSNSWEYTGDGYGMAYRAGAELIDMEFCQFHPTGMVWPPSVRGILVTEGVRGEGGILKNSDGERFMFNAIPERFAPETADTEEEAARWLEGDREARRPPELLTRDVVARAIRAQVLAGKGSPHGGAFLDVAVARDAEYIKKKLPSMYHQFKELAELDITKEPMEVGPTLHYFMGGILVDADSQQSPTVPGLFACGEASGGMHGANRLGGNSLSDLLVFGQLAGAGAKAYIESLGSDPEVRQDQLDAVLSQARAPLNRESGTNPFVVHEDLQDMMQAKVGIVREGPELEEAVTELERIGKDVAQVKAHSSSQYNASWHESLDLPNMMVTSEAVARAALMREESRGGHTREDFEGERDEWLQYNIIIRQAADGSMDVEKVQRPDPPEELAKIAHAKIEDLEAGNV
ncbi:MAG: fumarate reductase/succinate dehydrogenase flavoprotein subunit [Acidobacteriota bacterium]